MSSKKETRTERIRKDGAIFKAECAPDSSIAKCFQVLRESGLGEFADVIGYSPQ